jgi:signal transduction histidine kinase/CheY-like chemotaxis protein
MLFERMPDLVVLAEPDGGLLRLNPAARAFLGGRASEIATLHQLLDVVAPGLSATRHAGFSEALLGARDWQGSVELQDAFGNLIPYACTLASGADGVLLFARDTHEQRAREVVERQLIGRDEFVARLGHELRTPLNAMLGFAQLLELDDPPPQQRESIERILVGGRHMQSLLDEVLDLARLRTGGVDLDVGPVPVLDVVRGVVDLLEPLADKRAIRRYVEPQDDLVALADRRRLWQVLLNLIGNAVKYGREGGTVRVGVTADGIEGLRIEVADDGPGIDPDQLHRLFRPFERLGQERTGIEGTGLGLAMSQALTRAMGGELSATSRLGQGTTFTVHLQAVDRRELEEKPHEPGFESAATVVYVSAESGSAAMVGSALRSRLNVEVVVVARAAEALETVRSIQPALVLLDAELPDAAPTELLHRLGGDPLSTLVPKIVLTFDPDPGARLRLRAAGAADVLPLPLDVKTMLETVSRCLSRSANSAGSADRVGGQA